MGIEEDLAAIERRKRLAEVLMQQGAEDIPLQTAGGMVVPVSPLQGISKVANMLAGAYIGSKADKERAKIKQNRMDALGAIDFNSPDAASQLARNGFVEEAIKMRISKAEKAQENRYQPTNMVVTDPKTGVKYLRRFGSLPGNEITDTAPIPSDVQWLDTGGEFKPVPKQGVIPGQPGSAPSLEKPRYITNDEIIDAVIQAESGGNPNAVSPKGATGLMQLMPDTAKNPGFGIDPVKNDSVEENIRVGSEYLKELAKKYGGDQQKAFAAYNWGPGHVDNAITQFGDGWLAHAPEETQRYVAKLDKLLGGSVIKKRLTPAQEMQYSPVVAGEIKRAEAEAELPIKMAEEQAKAEISKTKEIETATGKKEAEAQVQAKIDLPQARANAEMTKTLIDEIYNHPGLSGYVGLPSPLKFLPGTSEQGFKAKLDQLKGKQFLEAFQSLKGAGQITEIEGTKATNAISALNNEDQKEDDFKKELIKLKEVIDAANQRLSQKAGEIPQPSQDNKKERLKAVFKGFE